MCDTLDIYSIVEDMQAEAEEFHRKITIAKFKHASITFNTFKPVESQPTHRPVSEADTDPQRDWLPDFSRNQNSLANQARLVRSYETLILMPKSENMANQKVINGMNLSQEDGTDDYYDKLVHQKREPTITSPTLYCSKNTDYYSDLNLQESPQLRPKCARPNDAEEKVKHKPKMRTTISNPLSPYTTVEELKFPPLPPVYNPRKNSVVGEGEELYLAPRQLQKIRSGKYDHLAGLIRVAWSCENLKPTPASAKVQDEMEIYDTPSFISPALVHKRDSMVLDQPLPSSLESLGSQDTYMEMSATHV